MTACGTGVAESGRAVGATGGGDGPRTVPLGQTPFLPPQEVSQGRGGGSGGRHSLYVRPRPPRSLGSLDHSADQLKRGEAGM